jgi:hypothetical protein
VYRTERDAGLATTRCNPAPEGYSPGWLKYGKRYCIAVTFSVFHVNNQALSTKSIDARGIYGW